MSPGSWVYMSWELKTSRELFERFTRMDEKSYLKDRILQSDLGRKKKEWKARDIYTQEHVTFKHFLLDWVTASNVLLWRGESAAKWLTRFIKTCIARPCEGKTMTFLIYCNVIELTLRQTFASYTCSKKNKHKEILNSFICQNTPTQKHWKHKGVKFNWVELTSN